MKPQNGISLSSRHFKYNPPTVGMTAGERGNWVVNQEQKMVEILLRSC